MQEVRVTEGGRARARMVDYDRVHLDVAIVLVLHNPELVSPRPRLLHGDLRTDRHRCRGENRLCLLSLQQNLDVLRACVCARRLALRICALPRQGRADDQALKARRARRAGAHAARRQ